MPRWEKCKKLAKENNLIPFWITKLGFDKALLLGQKYNFCCSNCNSPADLTVHHIDGAGWSKKHRGRAIPPNNSLENMVILCRKCHGSMEGRYGSERRFYRPRPTLICRVCGVEKPRDCFPQRVKEKTKTKAVCLRVCRGKCLKEFYKLYRQGINPRDVFNLGHDGRAIPGARDS